MNLNFLLTLPKKDILLLIFLIFYAWRIVTLWYRVFKTSVLLAYLREYLESVPTKASPDCPVEYLIKESSTYYPCLDNVLRHYPAMYSLEYNYITPLKYGKADSKNYKAAIEHYNELAMRRNFFVDDAKKSFNPLSAVQNLFSIPSRFLEWIGFNLSESFSKIWNIVVIVGSFFLGMYHNEIKSCLDLLVNLLFQHFFHN